MEVAYLSKSKTVVSYKKGDLVSPIQGILDKTTEKDLGDDNKIIEWGCKNNQPHSLLDLTDNNNLANPILGTKTNFVVGKGLITYQNIIDAKGKKQLKVVSIPEIEKFIEKTDLNDKLLNVQKDIQKLGNGFCQLIFNKAQTEIVDIAHQDATYCRISAMNTEGISPYIYLCKDWKNPSFSDNGNVIRLKSYIPYQNIWDTPEELQTWRKQLFPSFVVHLKHYEPGYPYYGIPSWYGTRKWIELANLIPEWHISGIKNGYAIRYLVEVSDAFFANVPIEEIEQAKDRLQDEIDACLAGFENAGKSLHIGMSQNLFSEGADKGVIRITPIQVDLKDDAFSILFENSNTAVPSGFTLAAPLAGIERSGGISSGSEMEHAYRIWLHLHAPTLRKVLLNPIKIISRINGWEEKYPGIQFGFENTELTTLDLNPTGTQNVII